MKIVIKLVLTVIIVALVYMIFESVMTPVRFNKQKDLRYAEVIQRLKDIRDGQRVFKMANQAYASDFDTLIMFLDTFQIPVVKMIPDPEDTTFTRSIKDTIGFVSAIDSLFKHHKNFKAADLAIIPFAPNKKRFDIDAGKINKGGYEVTVFEVKALNTDILYGLDEQLVINLNDKATSIDKYPGLKVGSMVEVSTDGNWE